MWMANPKPVEEKNFIPAKKSILKVAVPSKSNMQKIETLELKHFRPYDSLRIDFSPNINIITGDNAQGKTSLIEAIFTLVVTKSHKTTFDTALIKEGDDFAKITAQAKNGDKKLHLQLVISKEGKKAIHNHIEYKRLSDYMGLLNVVMFAPEDLFLIKGSPSERRRFIDLALSQINRHYVYHLNQYRKLLKERNEHLKRLQKKKSDDLILLDVLSEQLWHYAKKITEKRKVFLEELITYVQPIFKALSGKNDLRIEYEPSLLDGCDKSYKNKQTVDIALGTTTVGPHRDECAFFFAGQPVRKIASQGQIRTLTLALKLALIDYFKQEKKVTPIILLDDVFSELDRHHQKNLLTLLDKKAQIFITTTELANIDVTVLDHYKVIKIKSGTIEGVDTNGSDL